MLNQEMNLRTIYGQSGNHGQEITNLASLFGKIDETLHQSFSIKTCFFRIDINPLC